MKNLTVGTINDAPRVEWLKKTLKKIPKGSRILDAGAGEQQFKKFCKHLKYVSQDISQYDGHGDNTGLQTNEWDFTGIDIISDIVDIPESDSSFDAIMCTEVFEHIPDPVLAIKEFSRLIKSGGTLIITAPFCSITHFAPEYFSNGFSPYYYQKNLTAHGFMVKEITPNGNYFEYLAQEIRRLPEVAKKYSTYNDSLINILAAKKMLQMLQGFSDHDTGSNELLCFGYHVVAKRSSK